MAKMLGATDLFEIGASASTSCCHGEFASLLADTEPLPGWFK
jgi:hypothetical protein